MARRRKLGRLGSGFSLRNFSISGMTFWIPLDPKKPILRQDKARRDGLAPIISTKLEARQLMRIAAKSFFTKTKKDRDRIARQIRLSVRL